MFILSERLEAEVQLLRAALDSPRGCVRPGPGPLARAARARLVADGLLAPCRRRACAGEDCCHLIDTAAAARAAAAREARLPHLPRQPLLPLEV